MASEREAALEVAVAERNAELAELRTILGDVQLVVAEFTRLRVSMKEGGGDLPNTSFSMLGDMAQLRLPEDEPPRMQSPTRGDLSSLSSRSSRTSRMPAFVRSADGLDGFDGSPVSQGARLRSVGENAALQDDFAR